VEGYAGLVVHGPLQATLLLNAAATLTGAVPRTFTYRGLSPLTAGGAFRIHAARRAEGGVRCWADDGTGRVTFEAQGT
jgi:3-methylfumaryl-CoA hydratase